MARSKRQREKVHTSATKRSLSKYGWALIVTVTVIALLSLYYTNNSSSGQQGCSSCKAVQFSGNTQNPFTITLTVANASQPATGSQDKLTATVYFLGSPYQGATVNFTEFPTTATLVPTKVVTDSNGNAVSYISSRTTGNVIVYANYSTYSANVVIYFGSPLAITFAAANTQGLSGNVVIINGVTYTNAQLPLTILTASGGRTVYAYANAIVGASTEVTGPTVSGCGVSNTVGIVTASYNCTVTANYGTLAYKLTLAASPSAGGSPTCTSGCATNLGGGSYWVTANSAVTASAGTSGGYTFSSWSGNLYSGSDPAHFTMSAPVTETANFNAQASTTTLQSSSTTTVGYSSTTTIAYSTTTVAYSTTTVGTWTLYMYDSSPSGAPLSPGAGTATYGITAGSAYPISAGNISGYTFSGWDLSSGSPACLDCQWSGSSTSQSSSFWCTGTSGCVENVQAVFTAAGYSSTTTVGGGLPYGCGTDGYTGSFVCNGNYADQCTNLAGFVYEGGANNDCNGGSYNLCHTCGATDSLGNAEGTTSDDSDGCDSYTC